MAISNGYATVNDLADFTGASYQPRNSTNAEMAIESASRAIDHMCAQFFYDTLTASARTFRLNNDAAKVDPFLTTTGLIVATDSGGDGTYATTWAASDYELERFSGGAVDPAAPYDTIFSGIGNYSFGYYTTTRREFPLRVTARWGWASVPTAIKRATLVLAGEMMKDAETPFGVAGFDQFGVVRVRTNPRVEQLVAPYVRWDRRAGIA